MVNLLKGGIIFSDSITTVSRKYAEEIQTPEFGYGLEGVLYSRADHLHGIVNGVDYEEWDPATDKHLAANYTPANLQGKQLCKRALLETMGAHTPVLSRPVIGIVSRFASQKGFDLIATVAEQLAALDLYIVALGTGEPVFEGMFRTMAAKYPDKFLVKIAYDNALAHQIEAGSDMFLMPSRYEPCGLNQIYSLKYGSVPIVRATGGLDDTIEAFDGKSGTGFRFQEYSAQALLATIHAALEVYRTPKAWHQLVQNGMKKDFSWTTSARAYSQIYETLRKAKAD
jgi:starch synthase